ncbi:MAG: DUF4430 domain-containing protein, partial [Nanoarchaeota archaeon]|nr:DUF4430 domain-containing protein [Nanoarchaeota archaeon]
IEKEEGKAAEAWKMGPREDASLLKVMEGLAEEESIEMKTKNFAGLGVMIEELQGRKNGERGNYWQYWINDEYAKVGADAYVPRGGDIIEWKFLGQQNL